MNTLTPRLATPGSEPARRLGFTALVVDVLVRVADAYVRAENAVLRCRQAAKVPAPAALAPWASSEYPHPSRTPQTAVQTSTGAPLVGSPTRSAVVGRPVVGTNKAASVAAGK